MPGGWPCIVADPPWQFRDRGSRIAPDQRKKRLARKGYRTLSLDELLCLDVRAVAAPDALLFLWSTSAHLLDGTACEVARSWGFDPKVTMAWVKTRRGFPEIVVPVGSSDRPSGLTFGMGHYVRGAHELVVIARRGQARVLQHDVPSVFFAPRGEHSAKPEVFRNIVQRLAAGPYLELFARTQRSAWMTWGDQVGGRAA
jgi:N6-adenosine-specific RNA methylase IME4